MFSNVADEAVSAGDSADFIISQLIAFNQTTGDVSSNATHIIDAINETSNSFAVSSGDLAQGLSVVASTSAAMGNSLESTVGMMVAITEQTRSASKASRGLNTIMSRLSEVLDESSSNGEKIAQIYADLGLSMKDSNGQLKSGYELLSDLAGKWNDLDGNTQKYIATTIGSTTQLNNFLALMNNFDHAIEATNTAINSQGSALKENERAIDSIQGKQQALNATFEEFANNIIDNELVKNVLDLANGFLKLANTDFGQFVTQAGLLTGVGWGASSLLQVSHLLPIISGQFTTLGSILGMISTQGGLMNNVFAAGSLVVGNFGAVAFPVIATLSALGVGIYSIYQAWKEANPTLEDATAQIKSNTEQLESNKKRIEEINALPWDEKTTEILNEKVALEKENAELERQIKLYKEKKKAQIESEGFALTQRESEIRAYEVTGHGVGETGFVISENDIEKYERYGYVVEEVAKTASYTGEELRRKLTANVNYLTTAMEKGTFANDKYAEVMRAETLEALSYLAEDSIEYKNLLDQLTEATEEYSGVLATEAKNAEIVANGLELSKDAYDKIAKAQPKVIELTNEVNGLYYIEEKRLRQLVITSDQYKNGRIKDEYDLTVSVIENAQARIQALQAEMATLEEFGKTATDKELAQAEKLYGVKFNQTADAQATLSEAQNKLTKLLSGLSWTAVSTGGTDKSNTTKDPELERLKDVVTLRENELELLEERGDSEEAQIAKIREIQAALHDQAEYMRSIGEDEADVVALSTKWWTYEKKITSELDSQVKSLKRQLEVAKQYTELMENRVEDLTSRADLYSEVFTNFVDEQLDALEAEKTAIEEFYDNQINALKETNDELEAQIEHETVLKNLAEARSKKVLVYKNGQFQYAEDVDAVSVAQSELTRLEREQQLEAETKRLEKLKEAAVKSIDEQITEWENYKDEWEKLAQDVGKTQDEILAKEQLSAKLEADTWDKRVANLKNYVEEYKSLMAEIVSAQTALTAAQQQQAQLENQVAYASDKQNTLDNINAQMAANSAAWHTASAEEKKKLESANKILANQKASLTGTSASFNSASGTWSYTSGGDSSSNKTTAGEAVSKNLSTVASAVGGALSKLFGKHADGTLSAPGGISLVGEQGPELRVLNSGDGIIPSDITRNLWDWGKINPKSATMSSNNIFNIDNLTLPNARDAESLVVGLKQMAYQRAYKRA